MNDKLAIEAPALTPRGGTFRRQIERNHVTIPLSNVSAGVKFTYQTVLCAFSFVFAFYLIFFIFLFTKQSARSKIVNFGRL